MLVTALHFVIVLGYTWLGPRLPGRPLTESTFTITYHDGRGVLRDILVACTQARFSVSRLGVRREVPSSDERDPEGESDTAGAKERRRRDRVVSVELEVQGARGIAQLILTLSDLKGVISVTSGESTATEA